MIDAYTIGITLALDDNVSVGIATIRDQLLTLDRMIANTASALTDLQTFGRRIGSAVAAPPPPLRPAPKPPITQPSEIPPEPTHPVAPGGIRPVAPVATPLARVPSAPVVPQPPSSSETQTPPSTSVAPMRPPAALQGAVGKSSPQLADFAPPEPPAVVIPATPRATVLVERSAPNLPAYNLSAPAMPASPANPQSQSAQDRREPSSTSAATFSSFAPPYGVSRGASGITSMVPSAALRSNDAEPPFANGTTPIPRHDSLAMRADHEQQSQRPPVQMSGEITLEGAHLGRWVTDLLAEMASRPPNGATGFDPRMGPTWPGLTGG